MKSCIQAVEHYFDARTQNWIYCDEALFDKVIARKTNPKWVKRTVRQAEQKRRAYAAQSKHLSRAHTKVDILDIEQSPDKTSATVTAVEKICWAYYDKKSPAVECRLIYHKQVWQYSNQNWILIKASETSDGRSFQKEDESPKLSEQLRLPTGSYRSGKYDRLRSTRYADVWWDQHNPRYAKLSDDCTNFISQCLYAGGLPMTNLGDRVNGWWMKGTDPGKGAWSYSWTTSNALHQYVCNHLGANSVANPSELKMGDLIFYDWDGSGHYHHTTIVTDFDEAGDPLVNAHTDPSFHRPYTYYDSRAWTERTRYAFIHLPEQI